MTKSLTSPDADAAWAPAKGARGLTETAIRSARRTSYPALMLFLVAYLGALAIVFGPAEWLRPAPVTDAALDDSTAP